MQGKQGIVRYIYRGIVFIYDANEEENGGYITAKSNMCEKLKLSAGDCSEKVGILFLKCELYGHLKLLLMLFLSKIFTQGCDPDSLAFEDLPDSPKSPLSPEKPWQARDNCECKEA